MKSDENVKSIIQKFYRIDPQTKQRYKAGIFYAQVDYNKNAQYPIIEIGFSFCRKQDKFDYINGKYIKNHGLNIAKNRAEKYSKFLPVENNKPETHRIYIGAINLFPEAMYKIIIPSFAVKSLFDFTDRCLKYFHNNPYKSNVKIFTPVIPYWLNIIYSDKEEIFKIIKRKKYESNNTET